MNEYSGIKVLFFPLWQVGRKLFTPVVILPIRAKRNGCSIRCVADCYMPLSIFLSPLR